MRHRVIQPAIPAGRADEHGDPATAWRRAGDAAPGTVAFPGLHA